MAEQYAYGQKEVEGCECPAAQAGLGPAGPVTEVAEWYDTLIRNQTGLEVGVISEEKAAKTWKKAVQHFKDEGAEMYGDYDTGIYGDIVTAGEEVENRLF